MRVIRSSIFSMYKITLDLVQNTIARITKMESEDLKIASNLNSVSDARVMEKEKKSLVRLKNAMKLAFFDQHPHECGFNVHVKSEGLSRGRTFSFLASDPDSCIEWMDKISAAAAAAKKQSVPFYKTYQAAISTILLLELQIGY